MSSFYRVVVAFLCSVGNSGGSLNPDALKERKYQEVRSVLFQCYFPAFHWLFYHARLRCIFWRIRSATNRKWVWNPSYVSTVVMLVLGSGLLSIAVVIYSDDNGIVTPNFCGVQTPSIVLFNCRSDRDAADPFSQMLSRSLVYAFWISILISLR